MAKGGCGDEMFEEGVKDPDSHLIAAGDFNVSKILWLAGRSFLKTLRF